VSKIEGQSEHFMELYIPVSRQISNYCRALTGNKDIARDLLQDTLLSAFESMATIRNKDSFLYYLCATAKRIYMKQTRRNKFIGDSSEIDKWESISSEQEGDISMDIQILNKALDKLPVKQREALVLFEIVGFSLKEIKTMQGGGLSGVKSRIVRAREKLYSMLSDLESKGRKIGIDKKVEV